MEESYEQELATQFGLHRRMEAVEDTHQVVTSVSVCGCPQPFPKLFLQISNRFPCKKSKDQWLITRKFSTNPEFSLSTLLLLIAIIGLGSALYAKRQVF